MRQLAESINALRTSFWFAPAIMAVAAGLLGALALAFDHLPVPWPTSGSGEGAQLLLSTLAGSIITVTGVVFSLTIVTLHLASNQFGPRLLRSFMRDRSNQVVLGTFIATFVYSVIALVGGPRDGGPVVALALALTAASVVVLIYFIHHLAMAIQADSLVAHIGRQLDHQINALYPEAQEVSLAPSRDHRPQVLRARRDGYVVSIDAERLFEEAKRQKAMLQVLTRPGQFVTHGTPVLHAWPAAPQRLADQVVIGAQRTENEDIEFSIQQLAEMAVRGLSPGVNEPFTALACINQLAAAYCRMAQRDASANVHRDGEGVVVVPRASFSDVLDAGFGVIRQHVDTPLTQNGLMQALGRVAQHCQEPKRRAAVREHAAAVMARAEQQGHPAVDAGRLQQAFQAVMGELESPLMAR